MPSARRIRRPGRVAGAGILAPSTPQRGADALAALYGGAGPHGPPASVGFQTNVPVRARLLGTDLSLDFSLSHCPLGCLRAFRARRRGPPLRSCPSWDAGMSRTPCHRPVADCPRAARRRARDRSPQRHARRPRPRLSRPRAAPDGGGTATLSGHHQRGGRPPVSRHNHRRCGMDGRTADRLLTRGGAGGEGPVGHTRFPRARPGLSAVAPPHLISRRGSGRRAATVARRPARFQRATAGAPPPSAIFRNACQRFRSRWARRCSSEPSSASRAASSARRARSLRSPLSRSPGRMASSTRTRTSSPETWM